MISEHLYLGIQTLPSQYNSYRVLIHRNKQANAKNHLTDRLQMNKTYKSLNTIHMIHDPTKKCNK